jgi:hypothetical protein
LDALRLYVVEKVNTDNYKIYEINDPSNRVDYYDFDHGWILRAEGSNDV